MSTRLFTLSAALAAATMLIASPAALAQSQAGQTQQMQLPPDSPIISISAMLPQELRVGEQFQYQIEVRNTSDNVAVHNLVIEQQKSDSFQIEQTSVGKPDGQQQGSQQQGGQDQAQKQQDSQQQGGQQQDGKQSAQQQQQGNQQQQEQANQQQANQQGQQQQQQAGQQQQQQQQQAGGQQNQNRWMISMLNPGETKTIYVNAIAEKEGQAKACLMVTNFAPALCLQTEFVKPDLELVKNAPPEANLCGDIEVSYFVKNVGTGDAGRFVIRDSLGSGIQTIEGDKKLEFSVDGLREGDTRKFVAKLRASKAGEFSSRAVAEMEGGRTVNSNKTSTNVSQADLAVEITGPDTYYVNRPVTYAILVANRGKAPAPNATLRADFANAARVIDVGEPQQADPSALKQGQSAGNTPTAASATQQSQQSQGQNRQQASQQQTAGDQGQNQGQNQGQGQNQNQQQAQNQGQGQNQGQQQAQNQGQNQGQQQARNQQQGNQNAGGQQFQADRTWELGTLQPGQAKKIAVTLRFSEGGSVTHKAIAEFVCGNDAAQDKARAMASQQTRLLAFPDLLLAVVDNEGTVPQGEQVTYTITVKNQGEAPDQNVEIKAQLPEGLEFVNAEGPTKTENDGNNVTFAPVETLKPGDQVTYRITAKATGEGEVMFRTELNSKAMNQTATAEEPTRLIAQTAQAGGAEGGEQTQQQ